MRNPEPAPLPRRAPAPAPRSGDDSSPRRVSGTSEVEPSVAPGPTFRENLQAVFPLIVLAAGSFVASLFLFREVGGGTGTRLPLWLLTLSVGIVASIGASTALVFGDFSEPAPLLDAEAIRRGDLVLVPRAEWETLRRRPTPETASPARRVERAPLPALTGPSPTYPDLVVAPEEKPTPLWVESEFTEEHARRAGLTSRATDRLAEQVDALVRELGLTETLREAETPPPRPGTAHRDPASAAALASPSLAVEGADPRSEYEALLRELKSEAEASGADTLPPETLACSRCSRVIPVEESWEACPGCWRIYCPACLKSLRPSGDTFTCPACRHRSTTA